MIDRKIWWNEEELKYYAETASGETISVSQVVHVNFAGGSDLSYHNAQLGVNIDDISVDHADFSAEEIATILTTLNANDAGIVFVSDQSLLSGLTDYSTIYVGETHAFDALGRVKAISETTGKTAAAVRNDNAFVLMQNIDSMDELIETIWHETGHLTGALAHDDNQDGLTIDDFMATYSTPQTVAEGESKTFTGDLFKKNNEYTSQITNNGTLTLTGVTCTMNSAGVGGALSNYGTATITDSTFSSNYGEYMAGAIYNWGEATLYLSNTLFSFNRSINGKAIYNDGTIIIGGLVTLGVGQNIFNNATITVDGSKFSFTDGALAKAIDGYEGWCLGKGTVDQGTYNATSGYYVYFNENDGDLYVGNSSMIAVVADSSTTEVTVNGVTYQGKYYNTLSAALGSELKTIALSGTTQNTHLSIVAGVTFAATGTIFEKIALSNGNGAAIYNKGLLELEYVKFASMIQEAPLPEAAFFPKWQKIIPLGFLLGFLLGAGLAFLLDYLDFSFKTAEDLESQGLPFLGSVSALQNVDEKIDLSEYHKERSWHVLEDEMVNIKTNLRHRNIENPQRTIMLTGDMPSTGKSTMAIWLAQMLAAPEKKVLLIDCDLRKPSLARKLKRFSQDGFVDCMLAISEGGEVNDFIGETGLAHVDFMGHGKIPRRPNDFFESAHFDTLLKQLQQKYRYIIIDTPPGLNMADAFLIAQHVDGVIFVAEYGKSRIDHYTRLLKQWAPLNGKILGAILTKCPNHFASYYYYGEQSKKNQDENLS